MIRKRVETIMAKHARVAADHYGVGRLLDDLQDALEAQPTPAPEDEIERIARVLWRAAWGDRAQVLADLSWDDNADDWRMMAKAVLHALSERPGQEGGGA